LRRSRWRMPRGGGGRRQPDSRPRQTRFRANRVMICSARRRCARATTAVMPGRLSARHRARQATRADRDTHEAGNRHRADRAPRRRLAREARGLLLARVRRHRTQCHPLGRYTFCDSVWAGRVLLGPPPPLSCRIPGRGLSEGLPCDAGGRRTRAPGLGGWMSPRKGRSRPSRPPRRTGEGAMRASSSASAAHTCSTRRRSPYTAARPSTSPRRLERATLG